MHRSVWLALVLLLLPVVARAVESAPATSPHAIVTLSAETDSYRPGEPFRLGLRFRLAPGWHVYWRNPGDAGSPPEIAWTLPQGATAGEIAWPAPGRETFGQVTSYVYSQEVVLPVRITPPPGDAPLEIAAAANWLVCEKICVPEEGQFRLTLPPGPAEPTPEAALFAAADRRLPQPSPFPASLAPDGQLHVSGQGLSATTVQDAWFFPDAWGGIDQNAPQTLQIGTEGLTLRLMPGPQFGPDRPLSGVLALRDPQGNESFLTLSATPLAASPPGVGAVEALLLALAGGLVLNLMPCVFPVLAMKALAIARLSGHARRTVRAQALGYTAGAVLAFLALGAALLGLRAAGTAIGWGFQFQSPLFVAVLAWLLFAMGLNLSGVYAIGGRFAGAGQDLAGRGDLLGSVATGALAVVVATPCTAPFMGSAMAAATVAPAPLALGVFAALGLGLALPYALLAAVPRLAGLLPRPGAWMEVLRQALAFPLYGAAIWLLWVASRQSGPDGVVLVAGGMGLLGLAAWALGLAQRTAGRGRRAAQGIALAAALAACALLPSLTASAGPAPGSADGSEPFSPARLAELRAAGRPVFVDMTAAWCVTCLVNEKVALAPREVRDAFAAHDVAYLKGDWTRQDPEITAFLRAAGRDGVPLYVYYPPRGEPVVLPQILTPALVLAQVQSQSSQN
ncbi:protein-disulfide reductase DsbD family protein [Rhodovastum atsumiense]|uniref:protein-disulfide reductase DsbD family protein n=1 Tax=Rhodovastum atsumiense TaxID=504468 RepID=UPI001EF0FE3E|nr:protein-disulfide reductase DsbD domain-containing protein [Rhodovastum atsumiense]